jgi:hypothetical protein
MRNSNTPDLPPSDSTECEGLVKDVAREYSVQRSTLKKKVIIQLFTHSQLDHALDCRYPRREEG